MGLLLWLFIGLIAGGIARLLVPGQQPMGCLWTVGLGLAGSLVGGFLASLMFHSPWNASVRPSGLIMSTVGAILVLLIYARSQQRRY